MWKDVGCIENYKKISSKLIVNKWSIYICCSTKIEVTND